MFKAIQKVLAIIRNPPDPNWHVEKSAKPSKNHPLGGFWKRKSHHEFGLAIGPAGKGKYYISFCGPGGCFEKGTYRSISSIIDDSGYKVIDMNNIEVRVKRKFQKYTRATGRSNECL